MTATTWGAGEYALMADRLHPVAVLAADRAGVRPGERVVDVATGTGNAAIIAARRGAEVVGVDFEPALLDQARRHGADAGVAVRWATADVTALPVADGWADIVLSIFGVMYAADHDAAARELARAVAPAGRVVLAAWTPGSLMPAMGRALAGFLPPPPGGSGPPSRWGDADELDRLLASAGLRVHSATTKSLSMTFADSRAAAEFLVRTAGHVVAERDRLREQGRWDELLLAMQQLVDGRAQRVAGGVRLDSEYLLASATRP
jgi:SAM-dependent methyltransferase